MAKRPLQPGRRVQLHRAVSKLGWGSRTQAWEWVRAGRVHVDGLPVTDPLTWIDLGRQRVTLADGPPAAVTPIVLVLHKPAGVVTTRKDERGRRTVHDLLPPHLPYVFAAGRLDADSEGLLVLTNDSALAAHLTDPERHVPKTYRVTVRGRPDEAALARLRHGIDLADGPTRPAQVTLVRGGDRASEVEVVLTEGRNRQVRRMLAAVGHRVRRLVRVAVGALPLGDLPCGAFRELTPDEVRLLIGAWVSSGGAEGPK